MILYNAMRKPKENLNRIVVFFRFAQKFNGIYIYIPIVLETFYFLRFLNPFANSLGAEDWDLNFFYLESSLIPIRDFFQIPIWNPFYGGGYPILENPQAKLFSIAWWLGLWFNSLHGLKLSLYLYYISGGIGGIYLFYKHLKFSYLTSLLCTNLFIFSGTFPLHLYAGHSMFAAGLLIPLGVGFFLKARETKKLFYAGLSALVFANLVFEGAVYYFVYCFLAYSIMLILYPKEIFSFTKIHFSFFLILLLLISHRMIPAWIYLNSTGAFFLEDNSFFGIPELWKIFTISSQHPYVKNWETQAYNWWEYGNYIGSYSITLFLVMLVLIKRKQLPLLILLVVMILLMMGKFHKFSPASLLAEVPIFSRQRCFGRWGILVVFIFTILFGLLLKNLEKKIKTRNANLVFTIFLFLFVSYTSYDLLKFNSKHFKELFQIQTEFSQNKNLNQFPITITSLPSYGAISSMYPALISGFNTRDGYEMLFSSGRRKAKGEKDYKGEYYLEKGDKIKEITWTPNQIHFIIESEEVDILHINMSYNDGWHVKNGEIFPDQNGLVAIKVSQGINDITLLYDRIYYSWGLYGLLLGIFLIVYSGSVKEIE